MGPLHILYRVLSLIWGESHAVLCRSLGGEKVEPQRIHREIEGARGPKGSLSVRQIPEGVENKSERCEAGEKVTERESLQPETHNMAFL